MNPLLLNIDTAMPQASICLSKDDACIDLMKNESQRDHAAWLHPAIEQILRNNSVGLQDLDGIAVTSGPGSYTGLRIAMAAAKGFCFILKKPLILVNTLETMAFSAIQATDRDKETLYCPMIDARRMEVFTGIYTPNLAEYLPPAAVILDERFDMQLPVGRNVILFGNGSKKYQGSREVIDDVLTDASHLGQLAAKKFRENRFTPADQAVPFYGKAFYSPPVK